MRVLLVDIDSLRPDHLGCYGYSRDTSPTIDRIAAAGVRFENCFVSDSPCLPSRTALATGRHGIDTGVVTHFGEGQEYDDPGDGHAEDPDRPLAFRHLFEHGVRTATVTSFSQRHLAYHFTAGFQDHLQPSANTGSRADEAASDVTDAALRWLGSHATEDDWLLHVNYWDVHHPYEGITEYVDAVRESGDAAPWPDEDAIDAQQGMVGPRTADCWPTPNSYDVPPEERGQSEWPFPDRIEDRADVERFLDGYDAAIRKVDAEVETLLDALAAAGVREETAVVVTADHGEAFGDHGIYAEHAFPDQACQRVPLVVSWPGVTDGDGDTTNRETDGAQSGSEAGTDGALSPSVDGFIYQFDLVATLCELFGAPVPAGWDARPFTAALEADTRETFDGRDSLVCGHGIYTFGRALYTDEWTYIRLLHPGVFSWPGQYNDPDLPNDGRELLHRRREDPHGSENLVAERPERPPRCAPDGPVARRPTRGAVA
ncbi:sulfatase, partial [Halomarina oriensis]